MARLIISSITIFVVTAISMAEEPLPVPAVIEKPASPANAVPMAPVPALPFTVMPAATTEKLPTEVLPVAMPESNPPVAPTPPRDKAHPEPPAATPPTPPATTAPVDPAPVAAAKEKELGEKLGAMGKAIEGVAQNLTITTGDSKLKVLFGGALVGDFLFNSARPVAPGTPFFLSPRPLAGFEQQTFDANARQSLLFGYIKGPDVAGFESGGVVAVCFYDGSLIQDIYGVLPLQAYGQLKNNDWRFAAGLQFDIFNPLNPTVLPFSYLGGSGNAGSGFPAQARAERYLHLADDAQVTIIAGLSNPISTTVNSNLIVSEDNGWPNAEGRIALGLGCLTGEGPQAHRPFEVGLSGLIGQIRTTMPFQAQFVAGVWGVGSDARWAITERFGAQGEVFAGQTLGTYTAGILQNINATTFAGVHAAGGWAELYYYICPQTLHTHVGYGVDDPLDNDLAPGQPIRNETYFANLIWDPSKYFRWGFEVTYRKTAWTLFNNNDGVGIETQVQFKF